MTRREVERTVEWLTLTLLFAAIMAALWAPFAPSCADNAPAAEAAWISDDPPPGWLDADPPYAALYSCEGK